MKGIYNELKVKKTIWDPRTVEGFDSLPGGNNQKPFRNE